MLNDTKASIDVKHKIDGLRVICVDTKAWPIKK